MNIIVYIGYKLFRISLEKVTVLGLLCPDYQDIAFFTAQRGLE